MKKRILSESIVRYRGVGAAFLIAAAALDGFRSEIKEI